MGPEENLHPEQPTLDERKFYEGEPHLTQGVGQFFRPLHMLVPFDVRLSYLTSNSSQGKQVLKGQMSYPNTGAPAELLSCCQGVCSNECQSSLLWCLLCLLVWNGICPGKVSRQQPPKVLVWQNLGNTALCVASIEATEAAASRQQPRLFFIASALAKVA